MSYSNPTWYGVGNVGAFSKSFEKTFNTQFKSANDYYEAKAQEIEEYNNNLENQAEEQRKELLKGKEVTPQILADVESQVQKFLKEGRTFKEGQGFFGAPEVQKKTKAEMDEAAASFTGRIGVMNELLDNAISGKLQPKRDLDRGSATYLEYTRVMNAIKEDASNVKFNYEGNNKYDFTVTYKDADGNSKTVDSDYLKSIIELNNPEVRKFIDKSWDETTTSAVGLVKTAFSARVAEGEGGKDGKRGRDPRTGIAYIPEEDVDEIVKQQIGMMKPETVGDYFNNKVELNDAKRLDILKRTEDGKLLANTADNISGNESNEALAILLDIPKGDIKSRDSAFKKLGIKPEDAGKYIKALDEYRKAAVAEAFKQELKSKGLQSQYFRGQAPRIPPGISREIEAQDTFNKYAKQKGLETANTINTAISTIANPEKERSLGFGFGKRKKGGDYEIYKDDFEVDKIKVGGSVKEVRDVELSKDGKLSLVYDATTVKGSPVQDAVTYNIYDPASMRDFYSASSVQSVTGEKAMKLYSDLYDREMAKNYTKKQGLIALDNANMSKWFNFVYTKANDLQKQAILNYEFSNPTIRDMQDDFKIDYKTARTSN